MKNIVLITPPDAEYGFGLTGVPQKAVQPGDAESALKKTIEEPRNGLVVIDERLIRELSEERLRELEEGWSGILLVMPSPVKPEPEVEDYAARLIRRAIGYHVRLNL
jgi:vacuolar-type H+-ATPase subunit F/Vma7